MLAVIEFIGDILIRTLVALGFDVLGQVLAPKTPAAAARRQRLKNGLIGAVLIGWLCAVVLIVWHLTLSQ